MKKFLVLAVAVLATMISFNLLAECTGLSFDPAFDYYSTSEGSAPNKLVTLDLTGLSSEYVGMLILEFYNDANPEAWTESAAVGTYNLGGTNASFATCSQCVEFLVYENDGADYPFVAEYFQQEGTLQVTKTDFTGDYPYYAGVLSVKLAEATIDENTFATTFVENGGCYEVESGVWSNFPDGADTGDTGSDPADSGDTGDTGSDPADTGSDTGSEPTEPGDDTTPDETDDTGSNPPADNNEDTDGTNENEAGNTNNQSNYQIQPKEDDGGCSLVVL
jgi:hypothetical protein